jgi:hypothetical protein
MYVYHFKRKNMVGTKLIPLNSLKSAYPEVYNTHVKKYVGREKLLTRAIPILNCLWNDVLHLSPINPQLILDVWKENEMVLEARKCESFEVFKIPVNKLLTDKTITFQSFNFDYNEFDPSLNKYDKFCSDSYNELSHVPADQIKVWREDVATDRPMFWYSHIMHILFEGEIETSDCEVIICK